MDTGRVRNPIPIMIDFAEITVVCQEPDVVLGVI